MSMPWDRIAGLVHIVEKSRQWPKLQHLHDAAMRELESHAQDAKEDWEKEQAAVQKKVEQAERLKAASTPVEVPDPPGTAARRRSFTSDDTAQGKDE